MDNGWIKLHRKLKEKEYYKKPHYIALWIHLLLSANHKEEKIMWNGEVIIIKDGQFLTGRKELSKATGIPESTIERALNYFEKNGHQIGQQKTTKYRIITILNWHTHQIADSKTDNKRTTNGQQTDTNKNDKNDKNDKKEILDTSEQSSQITEIFSIFQKINPTINYGNKTQRSAITEMIKKLGFEKTKGSALYAVSIYDQQYAPTITTPHQLKENLGRLISYHAKNKNNIINLDEIK